MSDDPHPFKANRELGAKFARYITDNATLALLLSGAFAAVTQDKNGKTTNAVFHHTQHLNNRIELFKDVLKLLPDDHPQKSSLQNLAGDMKVCTDLRNKLAHGAIALSGDKSDVRLAVWITEKNRKAELMPITVEFLDEAINRQRRVIQKMNDFGFVQYAETVISVAQGTLFDTAPPSRPA